MAFQDFSMIGSHIFIHFLHIHLILFQITPDALRQPLQPIQVNVDRASMIFDHPVPVCRSSLCRGDAS